jgi:hypothetical protein
MSLFTSTLSARWINGARSTRRQAPTLIEAGSLRTVDVALYIHCAPLGGSRKRDPLYDSSGTHRSRQPANRVDVAFYIHRVRSVDQWSAIHPTTGSDTHRRRQLANRGCRFVHPPCSARWIDEARSTLRQLRHSSKSAACEPGGCRFFTSTVSARWINEARSKSAVLL